MFISPQNVENLTPNVDVLGWGVLYNCCLLRSHIYPHATQRLSLVVDMFLLVEYFVIFLTSSVTQILFIIDILIKEIYVQFMK